MKSTSSNAFASNANQNSGNVLTERPTTTLLAPPGKRIPICGRSTICLGESPEVTQTVPPGGKSSICLGMDGKDTAPVSSNAFACGVSQNCGNVLTERPTTLLHAPPGGHSTICLRHDEPAAAETPRRVCAGGASSVCLGTDVSGGLNHFRLSGKSSICLGMDGKDTAPVSSNAFACGVSQNCGNVLTERPTTLLHAPPGGHSTICLRHDEPAAAETPRRVCAGGASSVCLGTDVSEWSVSSRALGHSCAPIEEAS
eukprot:Skav221502  [mRNA]  locus=scaffold2743:106504:116434:- [translate_table: standard]